MSTDQDAKAPAAGLSATESAELAAAETRGRQWAATWLESDAAHAVLIAHSRYRIQDCRCGYAELGKSHTAHVLRELAAAMKEESGDGR